MASLQPPPYLASGGLTAGALRLPHPRQDGLGLTIIFDDVLYRQAVFQDFYNSA
jgi:hypothetical protein